MGARIMTRAIPRPRIHPNHASARPRHRRSFTLMDPRGAGLITGSSQSARRGCGRTPTLRTVASAMQTLPNLHDPAAVVTFWREAGPSRWYRKDPAFDDDFRARFADAHRAAAARELDGWQASAESTLALLLLLDQFPRNCFRGTAHMFATDPLARMFATRASERGFDRATAEELRAFMLLPFMHSEALVDQDRCLAACEALVPGNLKYAHEHRDIIVRFGRFPHRNAVLGRETTPEEQAFLDAGGFAG